MLESLRLYLCEEPTSLPDPPSLAPPPCPGLRYYAHNGKKGTAARYAEVKGSANPFGSVATGGVHGLYKPAFIDADNDGDDDLVLGRDKGGLTTYQRSGSGTEMRFTKITEGASTDPFKGFTKGYMSAPACTDNFQ